ncbi:glycosyl hydrolase catalytic core-domain-containing protein [Rhexocercosporidium sp. MPI-PUGE-AT-0058]|nr:glycosyl hydrolase catalytic core-domain-containing protein [Rhexocercosporidium sp. MPI-PUGE-AT-0058]
MSCVNISSLVFVFLLLFTRESTCADEDSIAVEDTYTHRLFESGHPVPVLTNIYPGTQINTLDMWKCASRTVLSPTGVVAISSFSVKVSLSVNLATQSPSTSKRSPLASGTSQTASANTITDTISSASTTSKRGVAYNNAAFVPAFSKFPRVSWAYNWADVTLDIPSRIEYVPMLWGLGNTDYWHSHAEDSIVSGTTHLLAFNEPDLASQANLTVATAVAGYLEHMEPFAEKVKLGSPAVTNGGGHMGLSWLQDFTSRCTSCTIDFVAIHWYNGGDVTAFKNYIMQAYKVGGYRPVWITEFRGPGLGEEEILFLEEVLPWLDTQDYVHRYAYFMASEGSLISGGILSALGETFASFA